jgi:CubicO group peptidase (beta-lactamase class C family)
MTLWRSPVVLLASVLDCGSARGVPQHAPSTGDPAILAVLERARTALSLPGVGARWIGIGAQVRSGEAVVGYRSLATLEPLALDDAFHLGSDTKAMTATLFMVGAERGALSWSATLGEVVPVAAIHPAYGNVSLAEVASHRAGLPRDATIEDLEAVEDLPAIAARRALVARVLARAPDGTRGTFAYSNVGYVLLGSIIESAEGRTYEEAMRARVFEPLGMSSCGFDAPGLGELPPYPGVPVGHDANNTPMPPGEKDRAIVVAAGSRTYCSLTDWSRFVADQLQGESGGGRLLSKDGYRSLHTPPDDGQYAFGLGVARSRGGRVLSHAGSNGLWNAVVLLRLDEGRAVLVAANRDAGDALAGSALELDALMTQAP